MEILDISQPLPILATIPQPNLCSKNKAYQVFEVHESHFNQHFSNTTYEFVWLQYFFFSKTVQCLLGYFHMENIYMIMML